MDGKRVAITRSHHRVTEGVMHRRTQYCAILAAGAIAAVACATDSPTATQPSCAAGTGPCVTYSSLGNPSYTISGVVYDNTPFGRQPAPGFLLDVWSAGYAAVTTDSAGRYSAPVWRDLVIVEPRGGSGFLAPCPGGTDWVGQNPNKSFDVDVVSTAVLSTSGLPESYHTSALYVTGTVTETTADGPRPVSGATVGLGIDTTLAYVTTLTDASGRYLVCTAPPGVGTDQSTPLTVMKSGYATASLFATPGFYFGSFDVELRRQN